MLDAKLLKALKSGRQIRITVTGRQSGRKISLTVWFVLEGERLMLLPVLGRETNWYRNLEKTPTLVISAGGATLTAKPELVTDRMKVGEVVERFRAKYGARDIKNYYSKLDACLEIPLH